MNVNILRRFYWCVRGFILTLLGIFIRKGPQSDIKQIKEV